MKMAQPRFKEPLLGGKTPCEQTSSTHVMGQGRGAEAHDALTRGVCAPGGPEGASGRVTAGSGEAEVKSCT